MQTNKKTKTVTYTLTKRQLDEIIQDSVRKVLGKIKNTVTQKRDSNGRFLPKYRVVAWFSYPSSQNPYNYVDRCVEVSEMDDEYIRGIDKTDKKFKCFRKDRIPYGTLATRRYRI